MFSYSVCDAAENGKKLYIFLRSMERVCSRLFSGTLCLVFSGLVVGVDVVSGVEPFW